MIEPNRQGEVWVFAEQEDGSLHDVSLELCGRAAELAARLGVKTGAVLPGHHVDEMALRLIAHGIDTVYATDDSRLGHFQTGSYARVLSTLIEKHRPQIVMYGATAMGRDLAPRVASTIQAGMTADCTELDISDVTDPKTKQLHHNLLLQIRPAFGGNIIATIVNYDWWPQMATVREGVMAMREPDLDRTGKVLYEKIELDETVLALKLIERHIEPRKLNLKGARVIVTGGGGIGSKDNFKLDLRSGRRDRRRRGRQPGRGRRRLYRQRAPDRADGDHGPPRPVHCRGRQRRGAAPCRNGRIGQDHRRQYRPQRADFFRGALRHRRRLQAGAADDDQVAQGKSVGKDEG